MVKFKMVDGAKIVPKSEFLLNLPALIVAPAKHISDAGSCAEFEKLA